MISNPFVLPHKGEERPSACFSDGRIKIKGASLPGRGSAGVRRGKNGGGEKIGRPTRLTDSRNGQKGPLRGMAIDLLRGKRKQKGEILEE
ncbi:hypothetical protein PVK06_004758 [Gossypium arboreum]|uniref:Uncharacterized protein n=1 Tax=Gossypium arboreum TaxID=29729 RepID=A0ABR0QTS5_GOSAR|nr:hypothetical protein PVK06_004758 [Gossypium arboreum]